MRTEVKKYLKSKYMLAGGGELPDDDTTDDQDTPDDEAPEADEQPDQAAPQAPAAQDDTPDEDEDDTDDAPTPAAPMSKADAVKAALMAKYNAAANSNATNIQQAKDTRDKLDLVSGLGRALEGAVRANSMAHGGQGINEGVYNAIQQQGDRGVADAQAQRQASLQGFLQKNALEDGLVKRQLEQGTLDQRNQALAYQKAANTPGTPVSLAKIDQFNKLFPQYAIDPKTGTAAQVDSTLKSVTAKAKIDATAEAAKGRAQSAADAAAARNAGLQDKADAKATTDEAKTYTEYRSKMDGGGRGVPKNVSNALVAQTNIKNAQEILNQAGGDPNKLNEQQVQMLTSEIAKIATGGVPTEATQGHLNPGTFQQKWNAFMGQVANKPQPAQLGAFMQQNADYLNGLKNVNDGVIDKYQQGVHKAYRDRLSPEHLNEAETDYPNVVPKSINAPSGNIPVASGPAPTKVVGGVTYQKVQGGWKRSQ